MYINFCGAAGEVTGSKHLLEINNNRVLLDCGMHQGRRQETRLQNSKLPFDAKSIDAVIISHGHLDHVGMLPVLVKSGYQGKIYATPATRDVAEWILKDAAHIQAHDAAYMNKHRLEGALEAEPIFTVDDVEKTLKYFVEVPYERDEPGWFDIKPGIRIKLYDAGHILGSAVILLEADEAGKKTKLIYTGDLGRKNTPLLRDPEIIKENVDTLILESTYGGKVHQSMDHAIDILASLVRGVYGRKGKIIVPAFAMGRTQELIYVLHRLTDEGKIPALPIYIDSPLSNKLTEVFFKYPNAYDEESWKDFGSKGERPLIFKNLNYVEDTGESKKLNSLPGPFMVIASSGMCEGGRIVHHLINGVDKSRNAILITGFQAQHTVGRRLVEKEKTIKFFGQKYPVRAEVVVLNEFSAHADQPALVDYARGISGLKNVFLVHGESSQSLVLKNDLDKVSKSWKINIPKTGERVQV